MRHLRSLALALTALGLAWGCGSSSKDDGNSGLGGSGTGAIAGAAGGGAVGGSGGTGGGIIIDGGGNSGGTAGDACASTEVVGTLVPANLLFVIDRSGSMNCNLPSDGQASSQCEAFPAPIDPTKATKWDLTKTALEQAIDDLELAGNVSAGVVVFPRPGSDCSVTQTPDVPIQTLDTTHNTDIDNFLATVDPKGKTPLAGAIILSFAHLNQLLQQNKLQGNLFVVLLTDGFETCKTDELPKLLTTDMDNAEALGIRTFVIGVPGSEDGRSTLSQIAWEGNTPKSAACVHTATPNDVGDCHFDMTTSQNFSQDLQAALAQISGTVLSCELDVPGAPPGKKINLDSLKVKVNGNDVSQGRQPTLRQGRERLAVLPRQVQGLPLWHGLRGRQEAPSRGQARPGLSRRHSLIVETSPRPWTSATPGGCALAWS